MSAELSSALAAGDPAEVAALLDSGADIHYTRDGGYDALIDAVHGRDVKKDPRLLDLLRLLVARGAPLSGVSRYQESALRVLSHVGRFDAVGFLLAAGADAALLKWTRLIRSVAIGSVGEVALALRERPDLEARDFWERTAWLVAILSGDVEKARLLREAGAVAGATGRCGQPSMHYAVQSREPSMLRWLIETGASIEVADEFGHTPLMVAAESRQLEMVDILLKAGADVLKERELEQSALSCCADAAVARRLLEAGADPQRLSFEARRAILGFPPEADEELLVCIPEERARGRKPRPGAANPEEIREPFWTAMIRSGVTAYQGGGSGDSPVWCAQRFGQSLTFLPDGRIVQIGGEHEDSYMPDFFIYNDVFVHEPGGAIRIFGYPLDVFPPTDSHSATLIGDWIYIIGCLGYTKDRKPGETPVFRLDTKTFAMERLKPKGEAPGWIYKHRAVIAGPGEIRVIGGKVFPEGDNEGTFVLDTARLVWRAEPKP